MKYKIKYNYDTGDSESAYPGQEDILEFEWENLEVAKICLKRIKEHYEWYEFKSGRGYYKFGKSGIPKPEWWNAGEEERSLDYYNINLPLDNGNEVQFCCPWCGYFVSLNFIEIVLDTSDMKIYM